MIPSPSSSPGSRDELIMAKADLSLLDRVRMVLAAPFFLVAIVLTPAAIRDALDSQTMVSGDEESGGAE